MRSEFGADAATLSTVGLEFKVGAECDDDSEEFSESVNDKAHSPFRNECAVLTSPAATYTSRPPEKYSTRSRHGVGSLFPLRTRLGSAILCEPKPSGSCLPLIQSAERLQCPFIACRSSFS